jgi:tetratricopeptide (TPR) repeat protein
LNKYLENPNANWQNERCYAMRLLGQAYEALGDRARARDWLLKATAEAPNTREPWVELADLSRRMEQWSQCYDYVTRALQIKDKALVYTMDPAVWGAKPHDLLALAAYQLGKYDEAVEHGQTACELEPSDSRLKRNLEFYSTAKAA